MDYNQMEKIIERLEHSLDKKISDDKMKVIHQELEKKWWSLQRLKSTIDYLVESYEKYSFPTIAEILKAGERFPNSQARLESSISCDLCDGTGLVSTRSKDGCRASFCCNRGHVINSEAYSKLRKWGQSPLNEGFKIEGSDEKSLDPENEKDLMAVKLLKQSAPRMYLNFIKSNPMVGGGFEGKLKGIPIQNEDSSKEIKREQTLKDDDKRDAGYRVKMNPGDLVDVF